MSEKRKGIFRSLFGRGSATRPASAPSTPRSAPASMLELDRSMLDAKLDDNWAACIDFGTALSKIVMVRRHEPGATGRSRSALFQCQDSRPSRALRRFISCRSEFTSVSARLLSTRTTELIIDDVSNRRNTTSARLINSSWRHPQVRQKIPRNSSLASICSCFC
jgi:hypothetical protein